MPELIKDNVLGASFSVDYDIRDFALPNMRLDVGVNIDNGAAASPGDAPSGTWQLLASFDRVNFFRVLDADAQLSRLAPTGNNAIVNGLVSLTGVPCTTLRLSYVRGSGGGSTSRCLLWADARPYR